MTITPMNQLQCNCKKNSCISVTLHRTCTNVNNNSQNCRMSRY